MGRYSGCRYQWRFQAILRGVAVRLSCGSGWVHRTPRRTARPPAAEPMASCLLVCGCVSSTSMRSCWGIDFSLALSAHAPTVEIFGADGEITYLVYNHGGPHT